MYALDTLFAILMTLVCGSNDSCESRGDLALLGTPNTLAAILKFLNIPLEGSASN